jgi:SAM-dependent methyltransferase
LRFSRASRTALHSRRTIREKMKARATNLLRVIRDYGRTLRWRVKEGSNVRFDAEGIPLPPAELLFLISGRFDNVDGYLLDGTLHLQNMQKVLEKNGIGIEAFDAILDFGCGCGRVLRQIRQRTSAKLFGCDYNAKLVGWCRQNLSFATFTQNRLQGNLEYPDRSFDFIYAWSVFTHLTEHQSIFWIDELRRVLRPGGYLYFTTHGRAFETLVPDALKEQFHAGKLVVKGEDMSGKNYCAAFHPQRYVQEEMTRGLKIIDFIEGKPERLEQDVYLMQMTEG